MPDTLPLSQPDNLTGLVGRTDEGEAMLSNGVSGEATLTVCVPCYRESADPLIVTLARMAEAARATLILYDDGSGDEATTRRLACHVMGFPGPARLITASMNKGRAHARNRLVAMAETDWLLFLDADMRPDREDFLTRYVDALHKTDGPALIAGGFSLQQVRPTRETALHAAQSARSECLSADQRAKAPGRFIFTSNVLVHKVILKAVAFDDGFKGWGWEDVDWGLRVADRYPVIHIDNTATHLGLDDTETLLDKFGNSGANFARLVGRHPEALRSMRLWRHARRFKALPARKTLTSLARWSTRQTWIPDNQRLLALKFYRALRYSEDL
ncbi:glycosyltransferase family 2 protein [Henriciella aquimarina]|uniref:glycosyltransferase family 2 protein n=1 Tax=Henriciella aquimarina TaxID=545261 RepID=UPI0009FBBE2F|nr:glycosyltransferase family A protein [Henriciella aquimarina]